MASYKVCMYFKKENILKVRIVLYIKGSFYSNLKQCYMCPYWILKTIL